MRRILPAILLAAGVSSLLFAQAGRKGPIVDKVLFDVRMQEDIALKDVAEGRTDLFMYGVQGPTFRALPPDTQKKLDVYNVPSGSWSIMVNPVPNEAPYTVSADGKDSFNPFAIREVRYALNFLIDRKYIVDQILGGAGQPMFTMATPGQPGANRYNLIPVKLGLTPSGNEKKAIQDITAALSQAAELPTLKGKLVRGDKFWQWNGQDLSVKFLIRVDDPNGRVREGRYIADQVEKAGIRVERLEWDRAKCTEVAYKSDPARCEWNLYTEAWGAGDTRQYWDNIVAQMYAPWQGYQAGGVNAQFWRYRNDEIDKLTRSVRNGQFKDSSGYWDPILKATELGLTEATRIQVASLSQLYAANRSRFNRRMVYGLGDGLNGWSIITADVKPDRGGTRTLRVTQLSARGSLFSSAWDPVGVDGFQDQYSLFISEPTVDRATFVTPNTAVDAPLRANWKDVLTKVALGADDKGSPTVEGQIPVPPEAVLYNPKTAAWEPVGPGVTSFSRATYTYKWGTWHTGIPIGTADIMYAQAFTEKWITRLADSDRAYDAGYESVMRPGQDTIRGIVVNPDSSITVYYNFNHMDPARIGASGALYTSVSASNQPVNCSWEIVEALEKMVSEGGASGTAWSFSSDPAYTEVDVLNPKCLDDITAKLKEFVASSYVPDSIKQFTTPEACMERYKAAIAWIAAHHNAYISNGPFFIDAVDTGANFVQLSAFRDPSYPFEAGYWNRYFKTSTTRIDAVTPPALAAHGKPIIIGLRVSTVEYPESTATPADATARVKLTMLASGAEKVYRGVFLKPGQYTFTIPAADTKALAAGTYTIIAESQLRGETPSVASSTLLLF
ncbi:MAG TPA: ABC transporter substrate-binding protein [Spirochaetia bacterium]|nr:ABC transporter substrate-binding protein [Spirochaetia bacterium]